MKYNLNRLKPGKIGMYATVLPLSDIDSRLGVEDTKEELYCPTWVSDKFKNLYRTLLGLSPDKKHILRETYDNLGIVDIDKILPVAIMPHKKSLLSRLYGADMVPLGQDEVEVDIEHPAVWATEYLMNCLSDLGIDEGDEIKITTLHFVPNFVINSQSIYREFT